MFLMEHREFGELRRFGTLMLKCAQGKEQPEIKQQRSSGAKSTSNRDFSA